MLWSGRARCVVPSSMTALSRTGVRGARLLRALGGGIQNDKVDAPVVRAVDLGHVRLIDGLNQIRIHDRITPIEQRDVDHGNLG